MDFLAKLFDVHKLPFKVIFWIFLVTAILAFAPVKVLEALKLEDLVKPIHIYISLIFLTSGCLIIVNLLWMLKGGIANFLASKRLKNRVFDELNGLDEKEKAVLREFFWQGQNTILLPISQPIVAGIKNKGLIKIVGTLGEYTSIGALIPCCLTKIARDFIEVLPDLIDWPIEKPEKEKEDKLRLLRPEFVSQIKRREDLYRKF